MKYTYTKAEITNAEDLVPGEHFIKIGEEYCDVLRGYWGAYAVVGITQSARVFLCLGCPVYTRQAVEPLTFERDSFAYTEISGLHYARIILPPEQAGKRFRCTEIMEDEG